jgi:YHS domain-containing protein
MFRYITLTTLVLCTLQIGAAPVSKSYWGDKAIGGHDSVAYHQPANQQEHKALKGNKRFLVQYQAANWYFASQESADKFKSDPDKYKPTYNGFCANALSLNEGLVATDGQVWEFFGDELFLFYAQRGRQRWLKGEWQEYRKVADSAWTSIVDG